MRERDELYQNFKLYFRPVAEDAINWRVVDKEALEIETHEGFFIYDNLNRVLSKKIDTSIDEGWKKEFARRLRRKMQLTGKYQVILAEETGISQPLLSAYANGQKLPSIMNIAKIAKALGCSTGDLVDF